MVNLKEIIDRFGWEKVQNGQFPPEIKVVVDKPVSGTHQYDLYALNGVCVVIEDGRNIVELSSISKTSHGCERTTKLPIGRVVEPQNPSIFLEGFRHLHRLRNNFLFVESEGMHFQGIGKRMEDAGELYKP